MKDSINKKLFEHSQGILEFTTENLQQQLLEQDLNHYIEWEKSYFLEFSWI